MAPLADRCWESGSSVCSGSGVLSGTLHATWKPGLSPVTLMTVGLSLKRNEPALPLLTESNGTVLPAASFPEVGV